MKSPLVLCAVWLLATAVVFCQSPTPTTAKPVADYSREAIVVERFINSSRFENDGTGSRELSARMRVQSEAGVQQCGLLVFSFDRSTEQVEIDYVRVIKPDGSVVVTPPDSVQDMPAEVTRQAPLYSDFRQKHVTVAALRPGDSLEYKVTGRTNVPLIPGQFWLDAAFDRDIIALDEKVVLDVPAERSLKLYVAPGIASQVAEKDGRRIYTWSSSTLGHKEVKPPEKSGQPSNQDELDIQATSFSSWDEFGKWFSQIQYSGPTAPEVTAKAAELTRGLKTEREQAEAIYRFVSEEIRYVGLEFGIGRYQAHRPEVVLANRYGDCKDKHALLAAMLRAEGITAYPVLVHASRKFRRDMPSPTQFNHLISAVTLGKDRVYLDTTAEVAPFGMLVSVLRDKEALTVAPSGTPEIVKTPADTPFLQSKILDVEGEVSSDGKLTARVTQTVRGDQELLFRIAFRRTPPDKWKDLAQAISYGTGFSGDVSEVSTSDIEDTTKPLQIKYRYTRDNYTTWDGDQGSMRTALPMMTLPAAKPAADGDSDVPLQLGPLAKVIYRNRLAIPPGSAGKVMPEVDANLGFAEYHSTSSFEGGTLSIERTLLVKQREVAAAGRADYEKFYKVVENEANAEVQLTRGAAMAPAPAAPASAVPGDEAFRAGVSAMRRGDVFGAVSKYQEAVKINPDHPYAWAELALAHGNLRDSDQALSEARRQLQVNPKHPDANLMIGGLLAARRDWEGARTALNRQLTTNPDDQRARMMLARVYIQRHNYKEALPHLEALRAGALEPSVAQPLAQAYLKTGSPEKALAVYEEWLKADATDPQVFNTAAYELADNNAHLDRALPWAEKSVALASAAVKDLDLKSLSDDDLRHVSGLLAIWDTMGWVYAKRDNMEKARTYLEAAWTTMQDATVADHLAYVYDRLGLKDKAGEFHSYMTAMKSQQPSSDGAPTVPPPQGSANGAAYRSNLRLQEMRTVHLNKKPAPDNVTGEFWVLLSAQGVEDVKFISGDAAAAGWTAALKAAKYPVAFPDELGAKLVRRGILSCHSTCLLVLLEPNQVRTVE